jgi:hypothetical protein
LFRLVTPIFWFFRVSFFLFDFASIMAWLN